MVYAVDLFLADPVMSRLDMLPYELRYHIVGYLSPEDVEQGCRALGIHHDDLLFDLERLGIDREMAIRRASRDQHRLVNIKQSKAYRLWCWLTEKKIKWWTDDTCSRDLYIDALQENGDVYSALLSEIQQLGFGVVEHHIRHLHYRSHPTLIVMVDPYPEKDPNGNDYHSRARAWVLCQELRELQYDYGQLFTTQDPEDQYMRSLRPFKELRDRPFGWSLFDGILCGVSRESDITSVYRVQDLAKALKVEPKTLNTFLEIPDYRSSEPDPRTKNLPHPGILLAQERLRQRRILELHQDPVYALWEYLYTVSDYWELRIEEEKLSFQDFTQARWEFEPSPMCIGGCLDPVKMADLGYDLDSGDDTFWVCTSLSPTIGLTTNPRSHVEILDKLIEIDRAFYNDFAYEGLLREWDGHVPSYYWGESERE